MNNEARERSRLAVVKYTIRDWPNNPKRRPKEMRDEQAMSEGQKRLWESLCDPLTTDEPLRLAMLDAALRVKEDHMNRVLESLGLSTESRAAIEEAMRQHRAELLAQQ